MAEKYCHSLGAVSYREGRFDSAVRYFRKAIALEDLPYTRLHLGLSYLGKNDLERALGEMTKAIDLAPSEAEYYYQRSAVYRLMGDTAKADEDLTTSIRLDPNYGRIEAIRTAAGALQAAFARVEEDRGPDDAKVRGGSLRAVLRAADSLEAAKRRAVEDASCPVAACPAYCCHFKGEPVLHGLWLGPWKLRAVRGFLKEKGLEEGDFLAKAPLDAGQERRRLVPPHVIVKDGAERVVFHPRTTGRPLAPSLVPALPRTIDYREIAWITAEARACSFLKKGRCMIHDLGGEPALPACKEFFCLTGYVFLILDRLGLPVRDRIESVPMEELNRIAADALLSLHARLYGNGGLRSIEKEMALMLDAARKADAEADDRAVADTVGRCRRLKAGYRRLFSRQRKLLEEDLQGLFEERGAG